MKTVLAVLVLLLSLLSSSLAQHTHSDIIDDKDYEARKARAIKEEGVTFVSLEHGVYTFTYKKTVIRAKCVGEDVGFHYSEGVCDLGDWIVGETMQGFEVFTHAEGYATVDTTGLKYNCTDCNKALGGKLVEFDIISWKRR